MRNGRNEKERTGSKVTVKTLKELQAIPGVKKKRKYHWLSLPDEEGVFLPSLMGHLCGNTYEVEGVNRRGKLIIHDERGELFTLSGWMTA